MSDYFDDFEYNDEEAEREYSKEENRKRNHPLYKQAKEIIQVVKALVASFKDERIKDMYGSTMTESAYIIEAKLSGAFAMNFYTGCMQNAALIREHAEYLRVSTSGLHMLDESHTEYIVVLREEMEKFRALFIEWVKEIREMDDVMEDEWGLFIRN
ncbi:MAG TPA: hypothetical protein VD905_18230 [Flavobacteriales bacterium]|nr:hypothetical protein [Flavobacteriales bacterium]